MDSSLKSFHKQKSAPAVLFPQIVEASAQFAGAVLDKNDTDFQGWGAGFLLFAFQLAVL